MKYLLLIILVVGISVAGMWFYLKQTYPQTPTQQSLVYFFDHMIHPHAKLNTHVMGFLPYWRIDDASSIRPELLSEVNYFSISPDADGTIRKETNGQTEPGWRAWNTQEVKDLQTKTQIAGTQFTLTLVTHENDVIESILDSSEAQDTLIKELLTEVKARKLDGVNIDFEYFGEPDQDFAQAFTIFSQKLAKKFKQEVPDASLSLSIMPRAARDASLFEFAKISPFYDHFIGMSYDYYGISSDIAGPIAPMSGYKTKKYFFDVETTYEDYAKYLPKKKLIMGVPYYGWDWPVVDGKTINSRTLSAADTTEEPAVISYARMRTAKEIKKNQCSWDSIAKETWCWYIDDEGINHQVWIADNKSVDTRFTYANKEKLGGVGIWVLTYDKGYNDLWALIQKQFTKK
jgi:spore germination protein YaaH